MEDILQSILNFALGGLVGAFAVTAVEYILSIFRKGNDSPKGAEVRTKKLGDASTYLAGIGGILGILQLLVHWDKLQELFRKLFLSYDLASPAYAQEGVKQAITPIIPYVVAAILTVIMIAFLMALLTSLILPDTKENQSRIRSADNIVKMFGGFLTGLGAAFFK